ncbi:MAG: hypothetical protein J0H99_09080, partial [Rhodospirillales bacterium]|nr:hypothetical protein [Rhodospirillales bacterium]
MIVAVPSKARASPQASHGCAIGTNHVAARAVSSGARDKARLNGTCRNASVKPSGAGAAYTGLMSIISSAVTRPARMSSTSAASLPKPSA